MFSNESNMEYIIGVEIGGSHVSVALIDVNGQLTEDSLKRFSIDSGKDTRSILDKIALPINLLLSKYSTYDIQGIAFAIPGPFDYQNGIGKYGEHVKYQALSNVNIKEAIQERLRTSEELSFRFLNDAFSFGVGEAWIGKTKNDTKSIAITLGTGCGAAFIEDGLPVFDRQNVPDSGVVWNMPFKDRMVDDYLSTRWFLNRGKEKYDINIREVKSFAATARKHDHAKELFREFGYNLSEVLEPLVDAFRPESIVFGGNISKAADLFMSELTSSIGMKRLDVKLYISENTEKTALIGSTKLFDPNVWEKLDGRLEII